MVKKLDEFIGNMRLKVNAVINPLLPEADEVFVRHSGNSGNDAITDR